MTNKEIAKEIKDEIIQKVKAAAKDENLAKMVAVLEVLNLPDEQIPPRTIIVIDGFADPIGNKDLVLQIIQEDKELMEYVIKKKHTSSHHKEQQLNYSLKNLLVDKKVRYGKRGKESIGLIR